MEKAAKTHHFGTVLAGAIILLLTALIILGAIFLPRMRENRLFSARYQMLQSAEYTVFLLSDPLYETGGAVATRGAEVVLSDEEVLAIRASLTALRESGFQNGENAVDADGAWDLRLQIRTSAGERAELYFTEAEIYFCAGGKAYPFQPADTARYEELYRLLRDILKANT